MFSEVLMKISSKTKVNRCCEISSDSQVSEDSSVKNAK